MHIQTSLLHWEYNFFLSDEMKNIAVPHGHILVLQVYVTSLFTNIPCSSVFDSLDRRFHTIHIICNWPFYKVRHMTNYLFDNTFFIFNGKYYKQIFRTPMGSPVSTLFANYVMKDFKRDCLKELKKLSKFSIHIIRI